MFDSGGIRTHATEVTGALNQRLRPLGHTTWILRNPQLSRPGHSSLSFAIVFSAYFPPKKAQTKFTKDKKYGLHNVPWFGKFTFR